MKQTLFLSCLNRDCFLQSNFTHERYSAYKNQSVPLASSLIDTHDTLEAPYSPSLLVRLSEARQPGASLPCFQGHQERAGPSMWIYRMTEGYPGAERDIIQLPVQRGETVQNGSLSSDDFCHLHNKQAKDSSRLSLQPSSFRLSPTWPRTNKKQRPMIHNHNPLF